MHEADQHCIGQALERFRDRRSNAWRNDNTGIEYGMTPIRSYEANGHYGRDFITEATVIDRVGEVGHLVPDAGRSMAERG